MNIQFGGLRPTQMTRFGNGQAEWQQKCDRSLKEAYAEFERTSQDRDLQVTLTLTRRPQDVQALSEAGLQNAELSKRTPVAYGRVAVSQLPELAALPEVGRVYHDVERQVVPQ